MGLRGFGKGELARNLSLWVWVRPWGRPNRKSRRRKRDFRQEFLVVLVAEVISGDSFVVMSESSDRESPDPPAFGGDDTESEEPSQYVCSEEESSETEGIVEGIIESRMIGHGGERGEPSVDSGSAAYREMQRNYIELEAIANRVLALPHTLEVGSSNQASPSGSVGIAVASVSEGVDIRVCVPLARRNTLTKRSWPASDRLLCSTLCGLEMMLAKLGYAPGQYNPNFWILLHEKYIAWWLAGLREPTFEQFMGILAGYKLIAERRRRWATLLVTSQLRKSPGGTGGAWLMVTGSVRQEERLVKWGPISKEYEDEVEWVRTQLSKTERECGNLVTQKNLLEFGLLQGMAGIIRRSTKVTVDINDDEIQKRLRSLGPRRQRRVLGRAQR
ncbi:hypothetical protein Prudu_016392 [Prunus dulcis]|uniref:Uncharacterized protein n=1 Tax=Prunus dulcis TaxID=3755 RepID=A0A4Y1RL57_PRUDU|nr:hypothetical protein Prudu_016392 [Prunus dulcis]